MRRPWLALTLLLFVPNPVEAHTHVWDVFFGPSYVRASHLAGVNVTLAVAPAPEAHPLKKVSLVFDASWHRGSHENGQADTVRLSRLALAGGVRITPHGDSAKHLTSFQFLIGNVRDKPSDSDGRLGVATGLMYEYLLNYSDGRGWAFRAQGDVFISDLDDFPRLSAGLAYHFK